MSLVITSDSPITTPTREKRMRKMVAEMMETLGHAGNSATGWTAAAAINWCIANGKGYKLTAYPMGGYRVEVLEL